MQIKAVTSRRLRKQFAKLPFTLYHSDPHWKAPLLLERLHALHPQKNPFFEHAQVQLFILEDEGKIIGRISAQIDHEYERFHGEKVGHFGFFECINDPAAAQLLFTAAEDFLRAQQIRRVLGPFSFSINHESGLLIEGFEEELMTMSPYNPPYYKELIEACDYHKAKDLLAWHYQLGEIPPEVISMTEDIRAYPDLVIRPLDMKNLRSDIAKIINVFNSAWSKNWGFVPMTEREIDLMAEQFKLVADPEIALIAEVKGEAAAICISLPNTYEYFTGLKGKLFPFGWARLLWRLKKRTCQSARLLLLGVKEEFKTYPLNTLSMLLYTEIHQRGQKRSYRWGELSWTLEDNHAINAGIEFMGGKISKRFRIYEKEL